MSDLRERLRDLQDHYSTSGQLGPGNERIFGEAADEIASLRAKLVTSQELCTKFEAAVGEDVGEILSLRAKLESARKALEEIEREDRMWTQQPGNREVLDRSDTGNVMIRHRYGQIAHDALSSLTDETGK